MLVHSIDLNEMNNLRRFNMEYLKQDELQKVNGGEINLDVNELVDQLNPSKRFYDFGHDVVYPYIWKPIMG